MLPACRSPVQISIFSGLSSGMCMHIGLWRWSWAASEDAQRVLSQCCIPLEMPGDPQASQVRVSLLTVEFPSRPSAPLVPSTPVELIFLCKGDSAAAAESCTLISLHLCLYKITVELTFFSFVAKKGDMATRV